MSISNTTKPVATAKLRIVSRTAGISSTVEMQFAAAAGLHSRLEHPPAMCFLDITGYTRLTQEHGDTAAASLAEQLGPQRTAVRHGGRPVKWLGDGVMLHFPGARRGCGARDGRQPGRGGLPPRACRPGCRGPVIFQEGDYYGQTVNLASRIAYFAQAGEVIVSREVVDAGAGAQWLSSAMSARCQ